MASTTIMFRLLSIVLLSCSAISWACKDGVDNVIKVTDTTNGKGKIIFEGVEIWTYDKDKQPSCVGSSAKRRANFLLPGHFKVAKGQVNIKEGVKENPNKPLQLVLNVEKQSWLIGVVCENGVSKNQFVPNELCKFDFCKIAGEKCGLLGNKTPGPIDLSLIVSQDLIDIGPMPIPQLGGDWKVSANILDGKKVVAGVRLGPKNDWISIETEEGAGGEVKYESVPGSENHDEL
ncbi:unnamed protein product [Auanema sp. JU1783]|nr:unnamed protein product [Auanema sp. JU1783]